MRTRFEEIDDALRGQGVRITQARRSIYHVLLLSDEPMSATQIDVALHGQEMSIDLVTVYRTLDTLERCGLIARADRLSDGWRYVVRSKAHRHSITCARCGSIAPLDRCDLERLEKSLEVTTGFADIRHSLQFYGTCPECQQ